MATPSKKSVSAQALAGDPTSFTGYLRKYNPRGKVQHRYCIINKGRFFYYKYPESIKPQRDFKLSGYQAKIGDDKSENMYRFQVKHETNKAMRSYIFQAASEQDRDTWVTVINKTVIQHFPDSLYRIDNTQSDEYDYISPDIIKTLPVDFTSEKKIVGPGYKGPTYNSKHQNAPTWNPGTPSPATPPVPERTITKNMTPSTSSEYLQMDAGVTTHPEHNIRKSFGRQDHVDIDCKPVPKPIPSNSMTDDYVDMITTKDGVKRVQDPEHSDDSEGPYIDVLDSDDDDDDDEGYYPHERTDVPDMPPESDKRLSQRNIPKFHPPNFMNELSNKINTPPVPSHSDDGVPDDNNRIDNLGKEIRSLSLFTPKEPSHPVIKRAETIPPYSHEFSEQGSNKHPSRRPIAPPVSPRVTKSTVQQTRTDNLTDQDVMPGSCMLANVQRDQCLGLLSPFEVGTYLIRTAREDGKNAIALLSRKSPPRVKHFIVFENEGGMYLAREEPKFNFLPDLIKYYYKNDLPQSDTKLTCPMSSPAVEVYI